MLQTAPQLEGKEFTIRGPNGLAIRLSVDEDGILSQEVMTSVILDGDDNELTVVEVEGVDGQPDQHFFAFADGIPSKYAQFAVDVDDLEVVPARYVRGVHGEKEMVELDEELEDFILADSSVGPMIRRVEDAEEGSEDSQEEEAQEEEE